MIALEFLRSIPFLPTSRERGRAGRPSNSELWRWLKSHSVIVNGERPLPTDSVEFPIKELVFFPKGNRVTMVKE